MTCPRLREYLCVLFITHCLQMINVLTKASTIIFNFIIIIGHWPISGSDVILIILLVSLGVEAEPLSTVDQINIIEATMMWSFFLLTFC